MMEKKQVSTQKTSENEMNAAFPIPTVEPVDSADRPPWRLGWRLLLTLLLLSALLLLSILSGYSAGAAERQQSTGTPLVLAFYYTWFDEQTWTPEKVPDFPLEPYVSRDRGVMGRHIDQARGAGIDALMVAWYGPTGQWNQTEPNFVAMLDEAAARSFKLGILFETDSPFFSGPGDATNALAHAIGQHVNHPAYLRVDGRPVIFFWRPHMWSVATWQGIRDRVDPGRNTIWIAEGIDMSYQAVFDGHHLYSNTWNPPSDLHATNQKFARWVADARQRHGSYKYWVATVMPGYNDLRTGRSNAFAKDREGGAYYERSWQAAIASNPDWIVITSFNEWPEGSYIEPSQAYGDHYLNLTRQWSQAFKSGYTPPAQSRSAAVAQAPAADPPTPTPTPEPTPTPTPRPPATEPTGYVTALILNLREDATTESAILAELPRDTALRITGRSAADPVWWQVIAGDRQGWVHGDYLDFDGPMQQVPTLSAGNLPAGAAEPDPPGMRTSHRLVWLLLGDVGRLVTNPSADPLLGGEGSD